MADRQPEQYFILLYHIPERQVQIMEFGRDLDAAVAAYSEQERIHRSEEAIEVVMVGADSIDTIKRTHSHYFAQTSEDLLDQFLSSL
jgi:hypothetical protein